MTTRSADGPRARHRRSLRTRLLGFGGLSLAILFSASAVAWNRFDHMRGEVAASHHASRMLVVANDAYQGWLTNDDQNNMYAAVVALRDPTKADLAETTFQQAVDGYRQAVDALEQAATLAQTDDERHLITAIQTGLTDYDVFTQRMRRAAQAGDVAATIRVMTVDNLDASNALPPAFDALLSYEQAAVDERAAAVDTSGRIGVALLVAIAVLGAAATAALTVFMTRSIARPVGRVTRQASGAVHDLKAVADELIGGARDTSVRASTVSAAGEQLSAGVVTIASALDQLSASFLQVSGHASAASTVADEAAQVVHESSETVTQLNQSSEAIDAIVEMIQSLAKQTNLLALNATIEAARAGEAGRGFAVVANSVKQLAGETAEATGHIVGLIEMIQNHAKATARANTTINDAVERIRDQSSNIAAAVEEQTVTVAEIARIMSGASRDVNEIAQSNLTLASTAEQNQAAAESTRTSADSIAGIADELTSLVFGQR